MTKRKAKEPRTVAELSHAVAAMMKAEVNETLLDALCVAARRARAAEIDASACGTSRDFRAARETEAAYEDLKAVTAAQLVQLIEAEGAAGETRARNAVRASLRALDTRGQSAKDIDAANELPKRPR